MKRHGLFVGVNAYEDKTIRQLRYSVPDASVLADRFRGLGYSTRLLADPTGAELKAAVMESVEGLGPGDVFLFFFAGHGFTAQDGAHLLFCRDDIQQLLRVNAAGIRVEAIEALTGGGVFHRAFLLDSCRTDCFANMECRGGGTTRDFDFVKMPKCTAASGSYYLLRSCDKFCPSLEFATIGHGLFTQGLLDAMDARDSRLANCDTSFATAVADMMAKRQSAHHVVDSQLQRPSIGEARGPAFSLFDRGFLSSEKTTTALPSSIMPPPVVPKRPLVKIATIAAIFALLAGGGLFYCKNQAVVKEGVRQQVRVDNAGVDRKVSEQKVELEKMAEVETKRLADEKVDRKMAGVEAEKPNPSVGDETKVQQEIIELRRLWALIDIRRTEMCEALEKVMPYRDDADVFAAHLATVDEAAKVFAAAKVPTDVSAAKALLERLQKAADTVAVELRWLERNKAARDRAKTFDGEIADLELELTRTKAAEVVPMSFAEGRWLQVEARKLLAGDMFESAAQTFGEAKAKLVETVAAAKAFQLKLALDEGHAYIDAEQWEKALAAAEHALEWDSANEDARKLKELVESHLAPSLTFVVKIEGREVKGAQVTIAGKTYMSPAELKNLEKGNRLATFSALYEADGKRYRKTFEAIDVDWMGPKTMTLILPEVSEPDAGVVKEFELPGGVSMKFVWCPQGTFKMGSPVSEEGRSDKETQHLVTLTKGFWVGQFEVTQAEWKSVMGSNPSYFKSDNRPVEQVSWDDCQRFIAKCNVVAKTKGVRFALPTEAQWEYACRAGSAGPYAGTGGLDKMGWYGGNSGRITHGNTSVFKRKETNPVGLKKPNAWHLYDMHGNVWEWCADWCAPYEGDCSDPKGPGLGDKRVLRGGGWSDNAQRCRSAGRGACRPSDRIKCIGFRLACFTEQAE